MQNRLKTEQNADRAPSSRDAALTSAPYSIRHREMPTWPLIQLPCNGV